jgi:lipopolysaccharide/colanic/teichoic acid biosynthesis glycosyltransferase
LIDISHKLYSAMRETSPGTKLYGRHIKRLLDFVLAGLALLILGPLFLVTAVIVGIGIGRPVFFRQERAGLNGECFNIIKFRTMTDAYDLEGRLLPDAQRLSRCGRFLRSTSLDELPELINVLKGEMSLVGPRPLFSKYLERYTREQTRRHDVLPGMTGWAQVNGRNALTWDEKFEFDLWYVDHQSPTIDLKIIVLTCWRLIKREGIQEPGHATAREFLGSAKNNL